MAEFTPEQREAIIEKVITGLQDGIPLAEMCREEGMPDRATIWRWAENDEELSQRIARARRIGFDVIAEEALEIADDGSNDWMRRQGRDDDDDAPWALNGEHVQRSKLRIETRLKLLAKWDPKRYGEALQLKHADADGEKLDLDPVARATRLASILSDIEKRREQGDEHGTD